MGDFKIIGITGSIGAGKSTLGEMLRKRGYAVIDLDLIGRELIQTSAEALAIYEKVLGPSVIRNGALDKEETKRILFQSPPKLKTLNSLIHPLIWDVFFKKAIAAKVPIVFCESALLVETGSYKKMDSLIVVTSPWIKRRERLLLRGEKDPDLIEKNQLPEREKVKVASFVIKNDLGEEEMNAQLETVLNQLISRH